MLWLMRSTSVVTLLTSTSLNKTWSAWEPTVLRAPWSVSLRLGAINCTTIWMLLTVSLDWALNLTCGERSLTLRPSNQLTLFRWLLPLPQPTLSLQWLLVPQYRNLMTYRPRFLALATLTPLSWHHWRLELYTKLMVLTVLTTLLISIRLALRFSLTQTCKRCW